MAVSLKVMSGQTQLAGSSENMVVPRGALFVIGRDPTSHWVLSDPLRSISATHCVIEADGDGFVLDDRSANGTFVNGSGSRLEGKHKLAHGDVINLGPYSIAVAMTNDAAPRAEPEPDDIWKVDDMHPAGVDHARGNDPAAISAKTPFVSTSMTVIRPAPKPNVRTAQERAPEAPPQAAAAFLTTLPPEAGFGGPIIPQSKAVSLDVVGSLAAAPTVSAAGSDRSMDLARPC